MKPVKHIVKTRNASSFSSSKKWFSDFGSRSWIFVEIVLVAVALGTPYWIDVERDINLLQTPREKTEFTSLKETRSSAARATITSRIITLPEPSSRARLSHLSPVEITVETKQFRFERKIQRGLASEELSWNLKNIKRQLSSGDWENISLIKGDEKTLVGSIFLELNNGENKFVVTFENARGENISYPVKIDFVRNEDS